VSVVICGASRGRYSKPIPIEQVKINWVSETERSVNPPLKLKCQSSDLLRCQSGSFWHPRKRWYPYNEMYVQKWVLTKKELREATRDFDMFSLEMPLKIICPYCAEKITKGGQ